MQLLAGATIVCTDIFLGNKSREEATRECNLETGSAVGSLLMEIIM